MRALVYAPQLIKPMHNNQMSVLQRAKYLLLIIPKQLLNNHCLEVNLLLHQQAIKIV